MTIENVAMGEQPIFTTKAHVFHIDPQTKKSWIHASSSAINVSFFYDSTRNLYRIISVEGTKAVINSTITPSMTFTKTSQKFGQWSDVRANTVYGLGFSTEAELNKFIEKFQDIKEALKQNAQKTQSNGTTVVTTPVTSASASPISIRSALKPVEDGVLLNQDGIDCIGSTGGSGTPINEVNSNLLRSNLVAHQRSQSLSGLQAPAAHSGTANATPGANATGSTQPTETAPGPYWQETSVAAASPAVPGIPATGEPQAVVPGEQPLQHPPLVQQPTAHQQQLQPRLEDHPEYSALKIKGKIGQPYDNFCSIKDIQRLFPDDDDDDDMEYWAL